MASAVILGTSVPTSAAGVEMAMESEEEVSREMMLELLIAAFLHVNGISSKSIAELTKCDCLSCKIMAEMYSQVEYMMDEKPEGYTH
jgi:hypothetical protein